MSQVVEVRPNGRKRVLTVNTMESRTVQTERDRADIRKIVQAYERTGVLVNMAKVDLAYRDVSEFTDFVDLMQAAKDAETAFLKLPSKVREVFNHDVAAWLDSAHDGLSERQVTQLTKLGVLEQVEDEAKPSGSPAAEGAEPIPR